MVKPKHLEPISNFPQEHRRPILCLHGLNQRPSALKPLLKDISHWGCDPYLLHLPGHCDEGGDGPLCSKQFYQALKESYEFLCTSHNQKPYFLGYSFGGLIGVHFSHSCVFEKMILLAPALKLHWHTSLIKPILPWVKRIPSIPIGHFWEEKYRYHLKGVPASVYRSFFLIYESFKRQKNDCLLSQSAIVFCHPKDELIHFKRLKKWVEDCTQWSFVELSNQEAKMRRYNHLCFDSDTLGTEQYKKLLGQIKSYLS